VTVALGWQIEFDGPAVARLESGALARVLARPGGRERWQEALTEARDLVRPAAVWELIPVEAIRHGSVFLAGGSRLSGGPVATVIAGASDLILAVCTVGEAISRRIKEHQQTRRLLRGVLLDELGTWAVDMLRQQLCRRLQDDAAACGLHASTSLSPGESEWPLKDQAVIFSALDTAQIGVSLSPTLVMSPLKSLSLIMGRGRQPLGREGGSHCEYCTMRERCTYRCRRESA
jgi:hypothetical protein